MLTGWMFSAPGPLPSPPGGGVRGSSGFWSSGIFSFQLSALSNQLCVLENLCKLLHLQEVMSPGNGFDYTTDSRSGGVIRWIRKTRATAQNAQDLPACCAKENRPEIGPISTNKDPRQFTLVDCGNWNVTPRSSFCLRVASRSRSAIRILRRCPGVRSNSVEP